MNEPSLVVLIISYEKASTLPGKAPNVMRLSKLLFQMALDKREL